MTPEDRAFKAVKECMALLVGVLVLSVVVGIILDKPQILLAGSVVATGASALLFFAFLHGLRSKD